MAVNYETLLCEVREAVATVTLNRPKVLNALNAKMFDELEEVFVALAGGCGGAGDSADGSGGEGVCGGGGYQRDCKDGCGDG